MTKGTLILANIQQDLKRIAFSRKEAVHSRYLNGLIFGSLLTILCAVFAINIGLIILLIAVTANCGFNYARYRDGG